MADNGEHRRRHVRHPAFHAEVIVGGRVYNIRDWSMGGVFFESAPDARIIAGDTVQVTLRFRFLHDTISVQQQALVTRTAKRGIAAEFAPMVTATRRQLERVLDSLYTQKFLESQIA